MATIEELAARQRAFVRARNWERFHTPRNLALALAGETGELVTELQWLSDERIPEHLDRGLRERLADEAADVLLYLIRLTEVCGIDLAAATEAKITRNETRFPVGGSDDLVEWYNGR